MLKKAVSVTLGADNLVWLRARAGATGVRSLSELLDQLVTQARAAGSVGPARSVVGTVDIDSGDPLLEGAAQAVRATFDASLRRPMMVKERRAEYGTIHSKKHRG